MSLNNPDTPIPTNIQQQNKPIFSTDSAISASIGEVITTDGNNDEGYGDNNQDGSECKDSLTKTISNSSYSHLNPTCLSLPENCAFASTKDNTYFHALFKSVPEQDRLLEIYKCALHRDILLQGHLYLSENYACFHANIFGWITNLVIEYNEVTLIERKMTALIIPNGIQIDTQHARHTFASFIFREAAYQQMISLWAIHQPQQQQQQQQQQKSQSSSTITGEWIMNSDVSESDTESISTSTSDEDMATCLDLLRQKQVLDNTNNQSSSSICYPTWKIMLLVFLLLNSLWMLRKWTQLDKRLQHQYHKHHHHQTLFNPHGLSSSPQVEKSLHHQHHPIYTKISHLRHRMESLNQQIIDQQLRVYDLSSSPTKLDTVV